MLTGISLAVRGTSCSTLFNIGLFDAVVVAAVVLADEGGDEDGHEGKRGEDAHGQRVVVRGCSAGRGAGDAPAVEDNADEQGNVAEAYVLNPEDDAVAGAEPAMGDDLGDDGPEDGGHHRIGYAQHHHQHDGNLSDVAINEVDKGFLVVHFFDIRVLKDKCLHFSDAVGIGICRMEAHVDRGQ